MQRDRILHRHPRPGAEREMHGAQRIPEEDDVPVGPVAVANDVRLEPQGSVGEKLVTAELGMEDLLAIPSALLVAHPVEPSPSPCVGIDFDEESARALAVLVAVGNEDAVRRLPENQRYRAEELVGAIPGKLVAAPFDMRLEMRGELLADRAVGAIRCDDHIDAGQCRDVIDTLAEIEHDTGALAGPLQDIEEINPRRARKVVALKRNVDAAMDDLHVVAALMPGGKFAVELLVGLAQEGESDAREDDTPAIGRVGGILLVDADLVARIVLLHEECEIEAGGPATDDSDLHGRSPRYQIR